MKLLSLYIENFGVLSDYRLDFSQGLTVIREPNGFGKTTLAEFIRAMFYGFPLRAGKELKRNPRKKYQPWQGGKYGGYLEFEEGGRRYRISRHFGKSHAQDSFKLFEGDNLSPSGAYSENIGQELFSLDSDSFERSSYMPQLGLSESLSSTGIQTKLTNLVEDTNDINNYDTALKKLKDRRTELKAFRGDTGSIASAVREISALQARLDEAAPLPDRLMEEKSKLLSMKNERQLMTDKREALRQELRQVSEAQATRAVQERYRELCERRDESERALEELKAELPETLPAEAELQALLPAYESLSGLKNKSWSEEERAGAEEIREKWALRFESLPTDEALSQAEEKNQKLVSLAGSAKNLQLSPGEAEEFRQLSEFFHKKCPSEAELSELKADSERLREYKIRQRSTALSPAEESELKELEEFFSPGVPSEAELAHAQQRLQEAGRLRQEESRIDALLRTAAPAQPERKKASLLPLIIPGLIALIGGAVLIYLKYSLPGGAALILGAGLLIGALVLGIKNMVRSELSAARGPMVNTDRESAELEKIRAALTEIDSELKNFCSPYLAAPEPGLNELNEISRRLGLYLPLKRRAEELERERGALEAEISRIENKLNAALEPFCGGTDDIFEALKLLSERLPAYKSLLRRSVELEEGLRDNEAQQKALKAELIDFLSPYFQDLSGSFAALITALRRERDEYISALRRLELISAAEREHEAKRAGALSKIRAFNEKYGLSLPEDSTAELLSLRDSVRTYLSLSQRFQMEKAAAERFLGENQEKIKAQLPEESADSDSLKAREAGLSADIQSLSAAVLRAEAEIRRLEADAEDIPRMEDRLSALKAQREEDSEKLRLLDMAAELLGKAKEELNNSYLGPVKEGFARYSGLLNGGRAEKACLSPELKLSLERGGEARELEYFSAGQSDSLMLCMRLALIDALFGDKRPFIILDDPFVNLDDEHMGEALKLLRSLAEERQILYLVCSSSRT